MTTHDIRREAVLGGRYRIVGDPEERHHFALFPAKRADGVLYERDYTVLVIDEWINREPGTRDRFTRLVRRPAPELEGRVTTPVDMDVDNERQHAWVAFETPWGETLDARTVAALLPLDDVRDALLTLASSLALVHDAGLVAEPSPENVWFGRKEGGLAVVTILVPGLVPLIRGARSKDTRVGPMEPVFSLSFLAPEVITGQIEGTPADVWTFALLAFELFTGASYWETVRARGTAFEFAAEMLTKPWPAASARAADTPRPSALPAGFDAWFARCLQREPEARPTMREAESSLRALLDAPATEVVNPTTPPILAGNPKGSFYDSGLPDLRVPQPPPWTQGANPFRDGPLIPPDRVVICANPKGSFYDQGLTGRGGRPRWNRVLPLVLFVFFVGASVYVCLAARR
jgi:hypothetical protein